MDAALLTKIFGRDQHWHGPCTVIMDADAAYYVVGQDALLGGGAKQYAPRMISGRVNADAACLLQDGSALLIVQQQKFRLTTGEESFKQSLMVADSAHVVAVELPDLSALAELGISNPGHLHSGPGSHPGTHMRPL